MHRPPLLPGEFIVLIFIRGWVDSRAMVRSEGNMLLKNPVTPPGIDPGTVRLVARRLNNYATPGPKYKNYSVLIQILNSKNVFYEYNVECKVTYRPFKWCPMMPYGITTFFSFIIRQNFHRISSCVHTLTYHIHASLWAENNNSVWLLFFQISFPTHTTQHCHRHLPPRLQNTQELAPLFTCWVTSAYTAVCRKGRAVR
jgi:hypothetical protein